MPSGSTRIPEIVIVGAGPGGLAAAMLLAVGGQARVTVLEARGQVGGRTSSIVLPSKAGNFTFDTGPTFFLYPRPLAEIFAACGYDLMREVPMTRLDPQYSLTFGSGGSLRASADPAQLAANIAALHGPDAAGLAPFLQENRAKLAAFRPVLESAFSGWGDLLRPTVMASLSQLRPFASVDKDLQRYFADPRVRLAFSFQSKYLGMSPFQCPSLFTILSFLEYEYGVWHPTGGCHQIMEKMANLAARLGVQVHLNEPVTAITQSGVGKTARATGVTTAKGHYPADAVVVNADFAGQIPRLIEGKQRRSWSDTRLAKASYSCSTYMLYLGVKGNFPELPHHNIYLSRNYEQNIADIESGRLTTHDPSFYVQHAGHTDASLAPAGHSALYVLVPVPNLQSGLDWPQLAPTYRRIILKQLTKLGLPDYTDRPDLVLAEKMITPADWQQQLAVGQGATFNLAHSLTQMLLLRPHNRYQDLGGVYLVGGGTHPGSGLPVIFESARISARLLREDLGLAPIYMPELDGKFPSLMPQGQNDAQQSNTQQTRAA